MTIAGVEGQRTNLRGIFSRADIVSPIPLDISDVESCTYVWYTLKVVSYLDGTEGCLAYSRQNPRWAYDSPS